jgi:signal transduction histidine kinase
MQKDTRKVVTKAALLSALATAALLAGVWTASAADGTAAEAKAMLDRAVTELKSNEAAALEKFNKPDGGFRDRDLYVFCFNTTTGNFTAHANASLVGKDVRSLKEKDGSPLGEKIFSSVKDTVTTVDYNFPRPTGGDPVPKESYIIKVGGEGCGVGYYK